MKEPEHHVRGRDRTIPGQRFWKMAAVAAFIGALGILAIDKASPGQVRGSDAQVRGSDAQVRGSDAQVRGSDAQVRGSDAQAKGSAGQVKAAASNETQSGHRE